MVYPFQIILYYTVKTKDTDEYSKIQFHYALRLHDITDPNNNQQQQQYWYSASCTSTTIPNDENTLFISSISPQPQQQRIKDTSQSISFFTGDSKHAILNQATDHAFHIAHSMITTTSSFSSSSSSSSTHEKSIPKKIQKGGTAAKMLAVSTTLNSMAILHFKTCLWDTCATEALVHAHGGKVTDLFGRPLIYSPNNRYKNGNIYGVVISSGQYNTRNKNGLSGGQIKKKYNKNKYILKSRGIGEISINEARSWIQSKIQGTKTDHHPFYHKPKKTITHLLCPHLSSSFYIEPFRCTWFARKVQSILPD